MAETPLITSANVANDATAVVVRLRGVRKAYNVGTPIETEVLHGIDLTLSKGEFCAVVGPSGSGKSTLLNIVGLLDRPSSGTLEVCGEQTSTLNDRELTRLRRHSIGFVFQFHNLITAFSARENVMMPMLGAAEFPNTAMHDYAATLIQSVGLRQWQDNLAGNLDSKTADEVFNLLRRFNREHHMTVLFVTHNTELASRCDKIINVIDGVVTP